MKRINGWYYRAPVALHPIDEGTQCTIGEDQKRYFPIIIDPIRWKSNEGNSWGGMLANSARTFFMFSWDETSKPEIGLTIPIWPYKALKWYFRYRPKAWRGSNKCPPMEPLIIDWPSLITY